MPTPHSAAGAYEAGAPDPADPAADEHAPIDLVSDTSDSDDDHSDSDDDSSVAVAVEPVDQAPADVPCVSDILAARDFTHFLLRDPHAPMVTVSLEEQALAPARTLIRVPYCEHLLELVQRGCLEADFHTAIEPALAQAHADLATYLATILVGLFDPARLALLPVALADFRSLAIPRW